MTKRIAMWSGPRNLSTAMMYSFAARGDCAAWDEPFYAAYLAATGIDHPMKAEIIATGETDPARVASRCAGDAPGGEPFFYQKHMTHHMIAGFPLDFMEACTNVFLIRHPARVIASYVAKRENPVLADLGFVEQAALFDRVAERMGKAPVVVDSADIRANPGPVLERLCNAIGVPWTPAMLHWPAGPKSFDGAFAPHWYGAVHKSTGFDAAEGPVPVLGADQAALLDAALPIYERMRGYAI